MKIKGMVVFLMMAALSAGGALRATVVATVGGEKIDDVELDAKIAAEERKDNRKLSAQEREGVLQSLINQRLLVALAKDEGLPKKDSVRRTLEDSQRDILSKIVYDQEVASQIKVGDDEIKNFFDTHPQLFELREVSQILVQPQAPDKLEQAQKKAKRLKAQVTANPKSFAAVAKAQSDDTLSKANGGDLHELRRGMLEKELEDPVFSAKPGSIIGPIQSKFGFHILYVRNSKQQTYEEAKDMIGREIGNARAADLQQKLLDSLRKKYKVSVNQIK